MLEIVCGAEANDVFVFSEIFVEIQNKPVDMNIIKNSIQEKFEKITRKKQAKE
jgi:hypothetical protein